jgi:hypothetical protein
MSVESTSVTKNPSNIHGNHWAFSCWAQKMGFKRTETTIPSAQISKEN